MKTFALVLLALLSIRSQALIAPWYIPEKLFAAAFDSDTCFTVKDPVQDPKTGNYSTAIETCSLARAQAWQLILNDKYAKDQEVVFRFKGKTVAPAKLTGATDEARIKSLATLVKVALQGNPNFVEIGVDDPKYPSQVLALAHADVIQYAIDDISNPWGLTTKTIEEFFGDLIADGVTIKADGEDHTYRINVTSDRKAPNAR